MISRLATIALALFLFSSSLLAQQASPAATPEPQELPSAELLPEPEKTISPEAPMEPGEAPLPAMDSPLPGEENLFGNDLFGFSNTVKEPTEPVIPERLPLLEDPKEAERKERVQFRKVKAVLDRDPQLLALEEAADLASTPEDHRAARRAYYALFFQKVRKANPKLSDYADRLEKSSLAFLYQTRIAPTVPLNPPPQPQPRAEFIPPLEYATPTPAPAPTETREPMGQN